MNDETLAAIVRQEKTAFLSNMNIAEGDTLEFRLHSTEGPVSHENAFRIVTYVEQAFTHLQLICMRPFRRTKAEMKLRADLIVGAVSG